MQSNHSHHHHLDEFSVSDLRHTLIETLRVIADRRWWFLIPFCTVATVAFVASHLVPRRYTTKTLFERHNDPVLAAHLGQRWTQPYEEQRGRLTADMTDKAGIVEVLAELDLPKGLKRFPDGGLTPESIKARERFAEEISGNLTAKFVESSPNRDLIELSLTLEERSHAAEILQGVRDRYYKATRNRTISVLQDGEKFYEEQSNLCVTKLREIESDMNDLENKYIGINPDSLDPIEGDRIRLGAERTEHRRRIAELNSTKEQEQRNLARLLERATNPTPALANTATATAVATAVNPRYAELRNEIDQIDREIEECVTAKGMTDQHPRVVSLRAKRRTRAEELNATPARIPAAEQVAAAGLDLSAEEARIKGRITDIDAQVASRTADIAGIEVQLAELAKRHDQTIEHRQEYLDLRAKATDARGVLNSWQLQLAPIRNILTVEFKKHGIKFVTKKEPQTAAKPSSPASIMVLSICVVCGAAAGVLFMLLSELIDRSFRTTKQITSALGVPLIESIDEIVTAAVRRKRFIRRVLFVPVATFVLLFAMCIAGTMAWLSLESPTDFERLKKTPQRTMKLILGQS